MPQWHDDLDKRKITGGRRSAYRGKRKYESGSYPAETHLGEPQQGKKDARGRSVKIKLLKAKYANVIIPDTMRTEKAEIERVVRNPVSVDLDRRRIITRGAIINTQLGEAVITSRPGQDGVINAVLLKKKE